MSGIKRAIEEKDPDYEEISVVHTNKRHKAIEQSGRNSALTFRCGMEMREDGSLILSVGVFCVKASEYAEYC